MQKRQEAVVNAATGHPVQGATVTVTTLLGVAATLYTADGSGLIIGNTVTTDPNGRYYYYAADGRYTETITGSGITSTVISDILLEDPVDGLAALSASGGSALVGFLPSGTGAIASTVQTELRRLVYPEQFGAVRDGTTDDLLAFQKADAYLVTLGGGTMRLLPGTYSLSARYQPSSGIELLGSGIGVTNIKNTAAGSPSNIAIDIRGAVGTSYAINTPIEGANTVTTTTAGNAGNFSTGDKIALAGALVGNDYIPFLITTVVTAVAGTGVITLAEKLRHTDYTLVLKVTSEITNVTLRNFSITQAADTGVIAKYTRGVVIENVLCTVTNGSFQLVGSRDLNVKNAVANGKTFLNHSCVDATYICPETRAADFSLEGGCSDVDVIGLKSYDPTTNGVTINTGSRRCRLIGGSVANVPSGSSGVSISNSGYNNVGDCTVIGMTLSGGGVAANGVTTGSSDRNTIVGNNIRGFTTGVRIGTGSCLDNVAFGNAIAGATNKYVVADGSSVISPMSPTTIQTFTDADTTPSVRNGNVFLAANTAGTSITFFDDGQVGQIITVYFSNGNTTLVASGTLRLNGSANLVGTANDVTQLVYNGSSWLQCAPVSANN